MGSMLMIVYWIGISIVTMCCAIVGMKCLWTFGLPYAMLRNTERRGWSFFPLIEFVPLMFAVLIAWTSNLSGWLSPKNIGFAGISLIALSYVHLVVVLMVAGFVRSRQKQLTRPGTKP